MANLLPPGAGLGSVINGLNYALANMNTTAGSANVLVANTSTGVVSTSNGAGTSSGVNSYLYNYIHIYYGNSATGSGFTSNSLNTSYYGVQNSSNIIASTNPVDYTWYKVTNTFLPGNALYYLPLGGNQVDFFAGNTANPPANYLPVLDSTPIILYIGGNNVVDTTQLVDAAVTTPIVATQAITNTVTSGYYSNYLSQSLYKRPKLVNYTYYNWSANTNSLILAATIIPTESNSTLLVNYSVFVDNDLQSNNNNYVAIWRSCNEGLLDPLLQQGPYDPYFPYQFRKVKMAYADPTNSSNIANATVVIGGFSKGVAFGGYGQNGIYAIGEFNAAGTYTSNILVGNATNSGSTYSYANFLNPTYVLGKEYMVGALNANQVNGAVDIEYPPAYNNANIGSSYYNVTATDWEPWGNVSNAHPYIFSTVLPSQQSNVYSYIDYVGNGQMVGPQFYSLICRSDKANGNVVVEANIDLTQINPTASITSNVIYGKINGIAHNVAPYSSTKTGILAIAVGDNATIFNSTRNYYANGVYSSSSTWTAEPNSLGGYVSFSGNLNAVAYSGPTDSQLISTLTAGAGKDANSSISNTFLSVGDNGIIIWRNNGNWQKVGGIPVQAHSITLRGICYDAYRYRWWVVGDYGTILWADDFSDPNGIVFNTYNSGTMRNLYDITWDPVTGYWTAVGDGIVITDNGTTVVNGQRTYPVGKAFSFDAMSGLYGTTPSVSNPIMNYEPLPVVQYVSGNSIPVLDGFNDYNQTGGNTTVRATPNFISENVTITAGQVIAGTYAEVPNPVEDAVIFNHNSYTPVTFYLVAGCATSANLIISNPSLTVTEIKR